MRQQTYVIVGDLAAGKAAQTLREKGIGGRVHLVIAPIGSRPHNAICRAKDGSDSIR